ncbi:hypothetical protein T484DRAFT_2522456 [Baffinella frigidus]|nr:hypothetical protein T484DRAFT_2522456 [Cryptophyta sp. CCMP2293]
MSTGGTNKGKNKDGGDLPTRQGKRDARDQVRAPGVVPPTKRHTGPDGSSSSTPLSRVTSDGTEGSLPPSSLALLTPALRTAAGLDSLTPERTRSIVSGVERVAGIIEAEGVPELSFAAKQMAKMGYTEGGGLGKDGQGRIEPTKASDKTPGDRGGIKTVDKFESGQMVHVEPRSVIVFRPPRKLEGEASLGLIVTGRKIQEYKMSKFCGSDIVLELLKQRTDPPADQRACWACYSVGNDLGFASRSALKLADIHGVCGELWGVEAASILLDPSGGGPVRFADLHGGRGGFSDYMLWRFGERVHRSFLVHRAGKPSATPANFKAPPEEGQLEVFPRGGAGMDPASLEDVEELVKQVLGESREGVSVVFGDGVCKQPAGSTARSSEPQSASTLWCQMLAVLRILEKDGSFICGITDTLGRPTIGAVYLLTHCFEKVTIIKPSMTSPSKSERYLVCIGFRGRADPGVEVRSPRIIPPIFRPILCRRAKLHAPGFHRCSRALWTRFAVFLVSND